MATGRYFKDIKERSDRSFVSDVVDTPELFLAASLQFLHRLLVERTTQCEKLDLDDIPITRECQNSQRSKSDQRYQDLREVSRIKRYKKQLHYMKNFLSVTHVGETTIPNFDCNSSTLGVTDIKGEKSGDPQSFGIKKSNIESSIVTPISYFDSSINPHSFSNRSELAASVSERRKIETGIKYESSIVNYNQRRTAPSLTGNYSQSSLSVNVQLEPETKETVKMVKLLVKVPSAVCQILNRKNSKHNTKVSNMNPTVKTQSYQGKKKGRLTSLLLNLLKGRRSSSSTTVSLEKDKSTSNRSLSNEGTDNMTENVNTDMTNVSNNRDTLICMLKNSSKNSQIIKDNYSGVKFFSRAQSNDNPTALVSANYESVNVDTANENLMFNSTLKVTNCKTKSWNERGAINVRKEFVNDEALSAQPEVDNDKVISIVKGWRNRNTENIIPFHFSEVSPPRLRNISRSNDISQLDIETLLNFAARMEETQIRYDRCTNNNHVEIPVQIKTTETPLHLHKTQNYYRDFHFDCDDSSENRVFQEELINSKKTPENRIQTEEFVQMLYTILLEVKSKPPEDLQQPINSREDSALQVLLRHIAAGSPAIPYSGRSASDSEKNTIVQTTPKRQLSKISVCCSSESLSNSDDDFDLGRKYSTIDTDECKIENHEFDSERTRPNLISEISNENKKIYYSQANKKNYIPGMTVDKMTNDKSESSTHFNPLISYDETAFENENSNLKLTLVVDRLERKFIPEEKREVEFEENNCRYFEAKVAKQVVEKSEGSYPAVRETESKMFCGTVLSGKIHGNHKELADAMIRWWGPKINYSTTPSSQTQISTYSVSINNLM